MEILTNLKDKLVSQGGDKSLITSLLLKAGTALLSGKKNFIVKLIMDRFIPREVRKLLDSWANLDDVLAPLLINLVKQFDNDPVKEPAVIYVLGLAKHLTVSMSTAVDNAINYLKPQIENFDEKLDKAVIEAASDNVNVNPKVSEVVGDMIKELYTTDDDKKGFEQL